LNFFFGSLRGRSFFCFFFSCGVSCAVN
jgi:hypothetical protein